MVMGDLSSTGECFDIGNTVRQAFLKYQQTNQPFAGSIEPETAGNGSLMRLAPVVLFYYPSHHEIAKSMGSVSLIFSFPILRRLSVPTSPYGNSPPHCLGFDFGLEPIIAQNPSLVRSLTDRSQFTLRHSAPKQ